MRFQVNLKPVLELCLEGALPLFPKSDKYEELGRGGGSVHIYIVYIYVVTKAIISIYLFTSITPITTHPYTG